MSPLIKACISSLQQWQDNPDLLLRSTTDCFGHDLDTSDNILKSVQGEVDEDMKAFFRLTASAVLKSSVDVLQRQMEEYITGALSSPSPALQDTLKEAPLTSILSERTLGMVDAQMRRARNASMKFTEAMVKAHINGTVVWLSTLDAAERQSLVLFAVREGRQWSEMKKQRQQWEEKKKEQRMKQKAQQRDKVQRGRIERKVKKLLVEKDIALLEMEISEEQRDMIVKIMDRPEELVNLQFQHRSRTTRSSRSVSEALSAQGAAAAEPVFHGSRSRTTRSSRPVQEARSAQLVAAANTALRGSRKHQYTPSC